MTNKGLSNTKELQTKVRKLAKKRISVWIYKFGIGITRLLGYRYFRLEVNDHTNLNLRDKFIIAPVHRSNLDAPLINSCSSRRINSLAKISMFKSKMALRISASIGCIPLNRNANDRLGIQAALDILKNNEAIMLFPEGLRSSGKEVAEIFGGCAYMSIKSGAPIVPVGIYGTEEIMPPGKKWPKRGYVNLEIGDVMHPPEKNSKSTRSQLTKQLYLNLQELLNAAAKKSTTRNPKADA